MGTWSDEVKSFSLFNDHNVSFFLNDHNVVCFLWSDTTFILFFHIDPARNVVACAIANSVTQERRYNSYVSRGAPQWLQNVLVRETLYCC